MTEPGDGAPPPAESSTDGAAPGDDGRPDAPVPATRPGLGTFTIEGRAAPGLFVVGWLGSLLGLGVTVVGFFSTGPFAVVLVIVGLLLLSLGLTAAAGAQTIERRARGAVYAGPSPILVVAATFASTFLAGGLIGGALAIAGVELPRPVADLASLIIQNVIVLALVGLLVVGPGALTWRELGFHREGAGANLVGGALVAAPIVLLTAFLSVIVVAALHVTPESPLPPTGSLPGTLLHLVAGAVVAPIGEETLFRGVATTAWVRSLGVRAGIVRAALLFVVVHLIGISATSFDEGVRLAVTAVIVRLPVALALGWIFVQRRSIWASVGLHGTFNAILILLSEAAIRGV